MFTQSLSSFSTGANAVHEVFHIGLEVAELGLTLFMIGSVSVSVPSDPWRPSIKFNIILNSRSLGTGPILFAPVSELYGRRIAILPAFFISACFAFSTATAKDAQTIFVSRFFCGFFGSAPIAVTAGSLSDIWEPKMRGTAMTVYAMAVIVGPLVAPVVGSAFVTTADLGWRWTEYVGRVQSLGPVVLFNGDFGGADLRIEQITGILILTILVADIFFLDETYAPTLLSRKAQHMRAAQGQWAVHAKHEEMQLDMKELATKYLLRPMTLIFCEPICFLMCLYASFVFGMIYM